MTTNGIDGFVMETRNWGKSVAFWQALGYVFEFETDHHSGQLRHPAGGPFIFLAENPLAEPSFQPVVRVAAASSFEPPSSAEVEQPFTAQHWGEQEMVLRDPDGRRLSVWAPLPEGAATAAAAHHADHP